MQYFKEISPYEMPGNVMDMIGNQWMLIAAKKEDKVNMMTASWGGAGVLWGKPVVFVFIRPQRYTKELVDAASGFSCTFFDKEYRSQLALCGAKSGRDINKVEACGFQVEDEGGVPYFTQAHTVLICQKLFRQPVDPAGFMTTNLDIAHYPQKDYHDFYVGEIKKLMVKQ